MSKQKGALRAFASQMEQGQKTPSARFFGLHPSARPHGALGGAHQINRPGRPLMSLTSQLADLNTDATLTPEEYLELAVVLMQLDEDARHLL